MNELILYTTEDGQSQIQLRTDGGTVWLTEPQVVKDSLTTGKTWPQLWVGSHARARRGLVVSCAYCSAMRPGLWSVSATGKPACRFIGGPASSGLGRGSALTGYKEPQP